MTARRFAGFLGLAYSQLGGLGEMQDAVPQAWLRLERTDPQSIYAVRNPETLRHVTGSHRLI